MRRIILLAGASLLFTAVQAQLEITHLSTRGYSRYGVASFFHYAWEIKGGNFITVETGLMSYEFALVLPVALVGYQHTFNGKGYGLYVEPQLTYSSGTADIPRRDSTEFPLLKDGKGHIKQPDLSGLMPGLSFGYIFPRLPGFTIGLRYEHIFTFGDPAVNIYSLRASYDLVFHRREH